MNNQKKITKSYLRNIAKYLDGNNFFEVFIKEDSAKFSTLLNQLNKHFAISKVNKKQSVLEQLYDLLLVNYRNDIVYKIEFLDNIDRFIKDIQDSFIVNEFKFGRNLTDLAVFNGKSIAFEIKSDLDRANNIEQQFQSYRETFDYCYLITHEEKIDDFIDKIPPETGIILPDDDFHFTLYREATMNEDISFNHLFRILRKDEYLDIVKKFYQEIPAVPNTKIFKECYGLLSNIEFSEFKNEFLNKIKSRNYSIKISELIKIEKIVRQGYLANSKIITGN